MGKTGVLTLHYGSNQGAILQALATTRLFDGEIVDHRYQSKLDAYSHTGFDRNYLQDFIRDSLPKSRTFVAKDFQDKPTLDFIQSRYKLLVYGSDELWKLHYIRRSRRHLVQALLTEPVRAIVDYSWAQRHPFYTPFPNIYWPSLDIPSVSFSGSIGETETASIPARHRKRMAASIERFQILGVRDTRTADFFSSISNAIGDRMLITPDPVFSWESTPADHENAMRVLEQGGIDTSKPFAFTNVTDAQEERCRKELAPLDLPSINLLKLPLTPPQWFAAIGAAKCGITSAMHGFISALVQTVPCFSIDKRFKSQELRECFGLAQCTSLCDVLDHWSTSQVESEAARRRSAISQFVNKSKNLVSA